MIAFIHNPMLSATKNSFRKALKISTFHYNALSAEKSNPFILAMFTPYEVKHNKLKAAITDWKSQISLQKGATLTVQQLFDTLSNEKIKAWDVFIQTKYINTTEEYKIILPNRRGPFQSGTQDDIVQALDLFIIAVTPYTPLAEIKKEAEAFKGMVDAALKRQREYMTLVKEKSETIELARQDVCYEQYGNLGSLMKENKTNPEVILKYFDLSVLGNTSQTEFTGQLKPGELYTIVKHTFEEGDKITLNNTGNTALKFYLAKERDLQAGTQGIIIPHGKVTEEATVLGDLNNTYLIVVNTDPIQAGSFEIEI